MARLQGFKLLESEALFSFEEDFINFKEITVRHKKKKPLANGSGKLSLNKGTAFNFRFEPNDLPFATVMNMLQVEDYKAIDGKLQSKSLKVEGSAIHLK